MTASQYAAHVAQLNAIIEDLQQKLLDQDFELQTCTDSNKHDVVHSTPQSSHHALVFILTLLVSQSYTEHSFFVEFTVNVIAAV